jgi:ATP-dependent DNA helicase RecG
MKESQNTEFKLSWHDEYLKWICGYANAKGGTLYIGIASLAMGLAAGR